MASISRERLTNLVYRNQTKTNCKHFYKQGWNSMICEYDSNSVYTKFLHKVLNIQGNNQTSRYSEQFFTQSIKYIWFNQPWNLRLQKK